MGFHFVGGGTLEEPRGSQQARATELKAGSPRFVSSCLFSSAGIKPKARQTDSANELHSQPHAVVLLGTKGPAVREKHESFRVPILPGPRRERIT